MDELRAAWHELKARVDELGAERQQYLEVFESACDAYLITDRAGVIREANGASVDLLQCRRRGLRGKPIAVLVALPQRGEFRRRLASLPPEGDRWRTRLRRDGSVIEVDVAARRTASGELCWRLQRASAS